MSRSAPIDVASRAGCSGSAVGGAASASIRFADDFCVLILSLSGMLAMSFDRMRIRLSAWD